MPCCEQNYEHCPIRNKCTVRTCKYNMEKAPVRDVSRSDMPANVGPPPPPPTGDGDWELQYCKWWGWTWVKKSDKVATTPEAVGAGGGAGKTPQSQPQQVQIKVPPCCPNNERKKGLFGCFKKKKCCNLDGMTMPMAVGGTKVQPQPPPKPPPPEVKPPKEPEKKPVEKTSDEDCCCCCCMDYDPCCCPCNQVCCPCMLQNQCCCCCAEAPQTCPKESKCVQTCCAEVKEQSTKMSELQIGAGGAPKPKPKPKPKGCNCGRRKMCMCRRPICCRCVRTPCCPCVQNVCCPRGEAPQKTNDRHSSESDSLKVDEKIINYCLNRNLRKPVNTDFLDFKSRNFSTLQKSLDILLKNNINIMNLFDDKRDLEFNPVSNLNSHHTITCLSSDNVGKKSDAEHCKLLTAVCDAILSSHKFDNDKFKTTVSCDVKDSQNSFNIMSNRGFIEKILSDLHLPMLKKSSNIVTALPVNKTFSNTPETCVQPRRSLSKLLRNKSRVLLAPRFSNKVDLLRKNNDLLKIGRHDSKSIKRIFFDSKVKERRKPEPSKINYFRSSDEDLNLSLDQLKLSSECTSTKPCIQTKPQPPLKLDNLEHLLNSIDYINGSTSGLGRPQKSDKRHSYDSLLQNGRNVHLLENTSPPFTDSDLLLSVDDAKSGSGKKDPQGNLRG